MPARAGCSKVAPADGSEGQLASQGNTISRLGVLDPGAGEVDATCFHRESGFPCRSMIWVFWSSFAALLLTKVADVVSTCRHVGGHGECNPLAATLFHRVGLAWGIAIVCVIYVGIALGQYWCVWSIGWLPLLWANSLIGFGIAWVQWDVARFNASGRHSWATRTAMRANLALGRWLARWRAR